MLLVFLLFFLSSSFDPNSIKFTLRSFRSLFCILAPMTWSFFCYQGEACRWCWLVRRSCLERGGIYYMSCYRFLERFSNDYQKADSKFITPTNHNRSKQRDEPSRISNDYREKWHAIEFSFASHWLKNWGEIFNPITKGSNRNHAVVFDTVI